MFALFQSDIMTVSCACVRKVTFMTIRILQTSSYIVGWDGDVDNSWYLSRGYSDVAKASPRAGYQ